jgi:putative transposase
MPRRLKRYTGCGDFHFVTFSCYERRALLESKRAKSTFVKILGEVRVRYGFRLAGYVVMPDHVHLLISEPPNGTPAQVIQVLKQRVSPALRGKKRGVQVQLPLSFAGDVAQRRRFWQRRYYDFNVYSEKKLREKLDYMHMNPVKRKLVKHPGEWPWSSWSFYAKAEALIAMDRWN